MAIVTFRDETATGKPLEEFSLPGLPERISARELVRLRVREEVARHNAAPAARFRGLVRPVDAEIELNGYRWGPRGASTGSVRPASPRRRSCVTASCCWWATPKP